MKYKVLTVGLREGALTYRDWQIIPAFGLKEAHQVISRQWVSLILINLEFLGEEAQALIKDMRRSQNVPVIAIGNSEGAYDWPVHREVDLFLPLSLPARQVIAYMSAMLQTHENTGPFLQLDPSEGWPVQQGDFFVDRVNCWAEVGGKPVRLHNDEVSLLVYFLLHPHRVIPYNRVDTWLRMIGCYADESRIVAGLREKIEPDPVAPVYIQTLPGIGYCFYDAR